MSDPTRPRGLSPQADLLMEIAETLCRHRAELASLYERTRTTLGQTTADILITPPGKATREAIDGMVSALDQLKAARGL